MTQRVDVARVDDLLERPARAALAFLRAGHVEPLPVTYRRRDGRHLVGLPPGAAPPEEARGRAVLVLDDGRYWFELRAATLRGRLVPVAAPAGLPVALAWLELVPERIVAWDYGLLHEEPA